VCFNQFQQPRKKIDGALNIPYNLNEIKNLGNIEEEILSRKLPEIWGKIQIGLVCYQVSTTLKADHYELNSDESVLAFVNNVKCKKSTQLCVYQEKVVKRKQTTYGTENEGGSKKFRVCFLCD
jgi:hypothetical protein